MTSKSARKRSRNARNTKPVKGNPTSGLAPPGRSRAAALMTAGPITRLPPNFGMFADHFAMRVRTSFALANKTAGTAPFLLVMNPGSISGASDYAGLGNYFTSLAAMTSQYSRFMISRLRVEATPTTAATNGGFIAINYEPTNSTRAIPPVTVRDVLTSTHSDVAQVTQTAAIECKPSDYFNTWLFTIGAAAGDQYDIAGATQIMGVNSEISAINVGLITIEVDIHFAGLRA